MPYFALHISIWVPLLSPFYYIFGSYTLLLFQNLALIFAGIGIVKLAQSQAISEKLIPWILAQFYLGFSIYAALAFDYHDNVIGACFVPWLWYYFQKDKPLPSLFCFLAILISKENLAIFAAFISIAMFVYSFRLNQKWKLISLGLFVFAITWFLFMGMYLMPSLNTEQKFEQLNRYSYLGSSISEIVIYIIKHPMYMLELFYKSHIQPDELEIVKQEFLFVLLLSGGIFLLLKPMYLWMALPILMQKLWNKELAFWGMSYHYQIELAPLVSMAIIAYLSMVKRPLFKSILVAITCLLTGLTSYLFMQDRKADYSVQRENIVSKEHYQAPFQLKEVHAKLKVIDPKAAVCAQSNIMPHVANREKLYHFPFIEDATVLLVLQPQLNSYPLAPEHAVLFIDSIRNSGYWQEDSLAFPLRVFTKK
ncbi:MAG: DUF2079 domain-containing protein [Bacteroidia bacterium]|nr:DUF2079 domain-containing protein [Bacteroidia bacterium]